MSEKPPRTTAQASSKETLRSTGEARAYVREQTQNENLVATVRKAKQEAEAEKRAAESAIKKRTKGDKTQEAKRARKQLSDEYKAEVARLSKLERVAKKLKDGAAPEKPGIGTAVKEVVIGADHPIPEITHLNGKKFAYKSLEGEELKSGDKKAARVVKKRDRAARKSLYDESVKDMVGQVREAAQFESPAKRQSELGKNYEKLLNSDEAWTPLETRTAALEARQALSESVRALEHPVVKEFDLDNPSSQEEKRKPIPPGASFRKKITTPPAPEVEPAPQAEERPIPSPEERNGILVGPYAGEEGAKKLAEKRVRREPPEKPRVEEPYLDEPLTLEQIDKLMEEPLSVEEAQRLRDVTLARFYKAKATMVELEHAVARLLLAQRGGSLSLGGKVALIEEARDFVRAARAERFSRTVVDEPEKKPLPEFKMPAILRARPKAPAKERKPFFGSKFMKNIKNGFLALTALGAATAIETVGTRRPQEDAMQRVATSPATPELRDAPVSGEIENPSVTEQLEAVPFSEVVEENPNMNLRETPPVVELPEGYERPLEDSDLLLTPEQQAERNERLTRGRRRGL